jgi:hypothetical protein
MWKDEGVEIYENMDTSLVWFLLEVLVLPLAYCLCR